MRGIPGRWRCQTGLIRWPLSRYVGAVAVLTVCLAGSGIAAQPVVNSEGPAESDWELSDEPLVRIGLSDGPPEYLFGNVTGAIRLADGSIIVADEQSHSLRKFAPNGDHLWTSGQYGKAPGEYQGLRLIRGCLDSELTVYDWDLDRITDLDAEGHVSDTRNLASFNVNPYGNPGCAPDGGLVFTPWPDFRSRIEQLNLSPGDSYRWSVSLNWQNQDLVTVLRSEIPGAERTVLDGGSRPKLWGRQLVFAAAPTGVWLGTADDYELEYIDYAGRFVHRARWNGPDLSVTRAQRQRYRESRLARYNTPEDRQRFEHRIWPDILKNLPARFPAYNAILPLPDGSIWVATHIWLAPRREVHLLSAKGAWLRRLYIPSDAQLLDAGRDWVLLLEHGDFGEPLVAAYELIKDSADAQF
ncbi:MAG: hypothetical protein OXU68_07250 [Bacteroidota bacterium]|nr:hypothetical protein [Bacteroidota bacterium]